VELFKLSRRDFERSSNSAKRKEGFERSSNSASRKGGFERSNSVIVDEILRDPQI